MESTKDQTAPRRFTAAEEATDLSAPIMVRPRRVHPRRQHWFQAGTYVIDEAAPAQVDPKAQNKADQAVAASEAKRLWKLLHDNAPSPVCESVLHCYRNHPKVLQLIFERLASLTLCNADRPIDQIYALGTLSERLPHLSLRQRDGSTDLFTHIPERSVDRIFDQLEHVLSRPDLAERERNERLNVILGNNLNAARVSGALERLKTIRIGERDGYFLLTSHLAARFAPKDSNELFSHLTSMLEHNAPAADFENCLAALDRRGAQNEIAKVLHALRDIKTNYVVSPTATGLSATQTIELLVPRRFPSAELALVLVQFLNHQAPVETLNRMTGGSKGNANPLVSGALAYLKHFTLQDGKTNALDALGRALPSRLAHSEVTAEELFQTLKGALHRLFRKDEEEDKRIAEEIRFAIGSNEDSPPVRAALERLKQLPLCKVDYEQRQVSHTAYEALRTVLPNRSETKPDHGKKKDTTPFSPHHRSMIQSRQRRQTCVSKKLRRQYGNRMPRARPSHNLLRRNCQFSRQPNLLASGRPRSTLSWSSTTRCEKNSSPKSLSFAACGSSATVILPKATTLIKPWNCKICSTNTSKIARCWYRSIPQSQSAKLMKRFIFEIWMSPRGRPSIALTTENKGSRYAIFRLKENRLLKSKLSFRRRAGSRTQRLKRPCRRMVDGPKRFVSSRKIRVPENPSRLIK